MKGHLRKRGKLWYAVLALGRDADGKHRQKWVNLDVTRKEDAETALRKLLDQYDQGIVPSSITFAEFADRWLPSHPVRESTRRAYRTTLNNNLLPDLGGTPLQKLSPLVIQELYTSLGERLEPGSVKHTHAVLHRMLAQAVRWRMLTTNPADAVDPPRVPRHRIAVWTAAQSQLFIAATEGTRHATLYYLALATGMRKGELLALAWEDIDWQGYVRIRQSLTRKEKGGWGLGDTKPGVSRVVTIGPDVLAVLRAHQERQDNDRAALYLPPSDWVFTTENGDRLPPGTLDSDFKAQVKRSGLPPIRFHDLRHTHATLLLLAGKHPKVVSERLGHTKVGITLDIYSHVLPQMQDEVAATIDTLLKPQPK